MIKLSDSAKECLDRYVKQMRAYLWGCKRVDTDEVERNIIEHIESELEGTTAAVSFEELDAVLKRLGSPRQWVPEEELPWWRKVIVQLRTGPEDWRLAYLSFGLLVLGFLFFTFSELFFVVAGASFIVARAALSAASDREELGVQRWLIYPPLIVAYCLVGPLLFLGGTFIAGGVADLVCDSTWVRRVAHMGTAILVVSFITTVTALWWTILGIALCMWPGPVRSLFKPFADWFNRKWAIALTCTGLGLLILTLGVVAYLRFAVFSTVY